MRLSPPRNTWMTPGLKKLYRAMVTPEVESLKVAEFVARGCDNAKIKSKVLDVGCGT